MTRAQLQRMKDYQPRALAPLGTWARVVEECRITLGKLRALDVVFCVVAGLAIMVIVWGALLMLNGCAPAAERMYETELLGCVDRAKTRKESRACREDKNQAWRVDAGRNDHGDR